MKIRYTLLTVSVGALLAGCAGDTPKPIVETEVPVQTVPMGTPTDPNDQQAVRTAEVVHSYPVGPYVDDQGVRHDGGNVERVEQTATWDLHQNTPNNIDMGPVQAVSDPNQEKSPMTAELAQKMQEQNDLLKVTTAQNDTMSAKIKDLTDALAKANAQADENAKTQAELAQLKNEVAEEKEAIAKTQETAAPAPAPASTAWWNLWAPKTSK